MEKHRIPLVIQISSSTHTGLVSYSLEHKHWIIADSQLILLESYDSESPAKDLINCFTDKSHIVMSWQFIGLKQQEVDIISTELMANPIWKNFITLTPERAHLPGHYEDYLAHLAAQNDAVATMQNILAIAPETVSKPIILIGSPLYQAVLAEQKAMVEWLLSHDKNIKNHVEAFWGSIQHRKLDMLTCLLEHGILKHIDEQLRDPLFEVYMTSPRSMAMTQELLKHGAKVTSTFLLSLQIRNDSNTHLFENHQKALLSQSLFRPGSSDAIKSDHTQAHGQTLITLTSSSIN